MPARGDRVHLRSYIADQQLHALYAESAAFVFLSEYEGFGLTPLEALAAGVPVVLLDTPVAREVCGDAALYVANGDIASTTIDYQVYRSGVQTSRLGLASAIAIVGVLVVALLLAGQLVLRRLRGEDQW